MLTLVVMDIIDWSGCWWCWSSSESCYWEQNWTTGEHWHWYIPSLALLSKV